MHTAVKLLSQDDVKATRSKILQYLQLRVLKNCRKFTTLKVFVCFEAETQLRPFKLSTNISRLDIRQSNMHWVTSKLMSKADNDGRIEWRDGGKSEEKHHNKFTH